MKERAIYPNHRLFLRWLICKRKVDGLRDRALHRSQDNLGRRLLRWQSTLLIRPMQRMPFREPHAELRAENGRLVIWVKGGVWISAGRVLGTRADQRSFLAPGLRAFVLVESRAWASTSLARKRHSRQPWSELTRPLSPASFKTRDSPSRLAERSLGAECLLASEDGAQGPRAYTHARARTSSHDRA